MGKYHHYPGIPLRISSSSRAAFVASVCTRTVVQSLSGLRRLSSLNDLTSPETALQSNIIVMNVTQLFHELNIGACLFNYYYYYCYFNAGPPAGLRSRQVARPPTRADALTEMTYRYITRVYFITFTFDLEYYGQDSDPSGSCRSHGCPSVREGIPLTRDLETLHLTDLGMLQMFNS